MPPHHARLDKRGSNVVSIANVGDFQTSRLFKESLHGDDIRDRLTWMVLIAESVNYWNLHDRRELPYGFVPEHTRHNDITETFEVSSDVRDRFPPPLVTTTCEYLLA